VLQKPYEIIRRDAGLRPGAGAMSEQLVWPMRKTNRRQQDRGVENHTCCRSSVEEINLTLPTSWQPPREGTALLYAWVIWFRTALVKAIGACSAPRSAIRPSGSAAAHSYAGQEDGEDLAPLREQLNPRSMPRSMSACPHADGRARTHANPTRVGPNLDADAKVAARPDWKDPADMLAELPGPNDEAKNEDKNVDGS